MKKEERLNEEAAMNNNLGSSTYQTNHEIRKEHKKPKMSNRTKTDIDQVQG